MKTSIQYAGALENAPAGIGHKWILTDTAY